jgi:hypothetical protein
MVEVANAFCAHVPRPITYIHMPVPLARDDDAYFRPLRDLRLSASTELYLGLVHAADGADGTLRRIETARRHVQGFGIATECGIARARTRRTVEELLRIHAETSREPAAASRRA